MKRKLLLFIPLVVFISSIFTLNSLASQSPSSKAEVNSGSDYSVKTIPFNWIEIASTGTHLMLDDDDYETVVLPFSFPFYDDVFTEVNVSSNGFLIFDKSADPNSQLFGVIPQTSFQYVIALFWMDLYPDDGYGGGGVYYQSFGNYIIVQFDHISSCCNGNLAGDFEVILYSSGKVQMFYDNMNSTAGTIGVDRGNNLNYTTYPSLTLPTNQLGIEFFSSQGVTITSPPYYLERDENYTIEWNPRNASDVSYYEIFVNSLSQGTTTSTSMNVSISIGQTYDIEVVLYALDLSTYQDQISIIMHEPLVTGLSIGDTLTYEFFMEDLDGETTVDGSYLINNVQITNEISPNMWEVTFTYEYYTDETSSTPNDISVETELLDGEFLDPLANVWSNAHHCSIGDSIIALSSPSSTTTTGTKIVGEKLVELPKVGISIPCWKVEIDSEDFPETLNKYEIYFCKSTGVIVSLEVPDYVSGGLKGFNYPFGDILHPYLTINQPEDGHKTDDDFIEVSVTVVDDKTDLSVRVKLGNGDWEEMDLTGTNEWSYTFTGVEAGSYTIYIKVTDSDGNQVKKSVTVKVNQEEEESSQPPSITPGLELMVPIICLFSIIILQRRKKSNKIDK